MGETPFSLRGRRATGGAVQDPALHSYMAEAGASQSWEFQAYHDHWSRRFQILLSQLVAVFKIE